MTGEALHARSKHETMYEYPRKVETTPRTSLHLTKLDHETLPYDESKPEDAGQSTAEHEPYLAFPTLEKGLLSIRQNIRTPVPCTPG